MPCGDNAASDRYYQERIKKEDAYAFELLKKELLRQKERNDEIARYLCAILKYLERNHGENSVDSIFDVLDENGIRGWWFDHKEFDKRRRENE